jgi:hypothetical protein
MGSKCRIKVAFNLSTTKPKYVRLDYMHQQLMIRKTSNKVIPRYITSSTMAITNVKCIGSGSHIRNTEARRRQRCILNSLPKEDNLR